MEKENIDLILSNQMASYNKSELGYQHNKLFISIFHTKKNQSTNL